MLKVSMVLFTEVATVYFVIYIFYSWSVRYELINQISMIQIQELSHVIFSFKIIIAYI